MTQQAQPNSSSDGQQARPDMLPVTPMVPVIPAGWRLPDRYLLTKRIGAGAYGSVYKARDLFKDREVAVKRVSGLFESLTDSKRILREVNILAQLRSKSTVTLYDVIKPVTGEFNELYIVMELVHSDLKKLFRMDIILSPMHINVILYNLLAGVRYLHSAGVYHRDLKPANVFINQDCSVKIGDFGLACAVHDEEAGTEAFSRTPLDTDQGEAASPGELVGRIVPSTARMRRALTRHVVTRWYRAPELILLQKKYTGAIDMWSVGCIYAESLGMLPGTRIEDRGPLFPGSTCYPLSPAEAHETDYRYHTSGEKEQLNVIFDLLGTPSEADIEALDSDSSKRYTRAFARREGRGLRSRWPDVESNSMDILEKMLVFNPERRLSLPEALEHPLFSDQSEPIRDLDNEFTAEKQVKLDFDAEPGRMQRGRLEIGFNDLIAQLHQEL